MTSPPTGSGLIGRFVRLSFARPWLVLLTFGLVGVLGAALASKLVFRGSFVELLPDSAREVQDLKVVSEKAGGDGYLVVQLQGADQDTLKAFANAVAPKLEQLKEVRYVEYRYDTRFFEDRALWLLPPEKLASLGVDLKRRIDWEKQQANPLFVDLTDEAPPLTFEQIENKYGSDAPRSPYIVSKDAKELYLFVKPTGLAGDLEFSKRLLDRIDGEVRALATRFPAVKADYTGAFRIRLEEDAVMKQDLSVASMVSAFVAVLLILFATRRASALMVVGAPMMLGLAITFGVAQLGIGHLNVVTGFLVAILIGLGIEYGIHLAMRYWEERRNLPAVEAMEVAYRGTLAGAATSSLTNAAAFLVLVFASFPAFVQFGFIAGIGVLLTVFAAYAAGPSVLAIAERIRPLTHVPLATEGAQDGLCKKGLPTALIATLALSVIGFAAYSAVVAHQLRFENDLRKLKGDSPATRLDDHIAEQIGVKITPAILLVDGVSQGKVVTELIEASKKDHGEQTAFQKAAALHQLLPSDVPAQQREIDRIAELMRDLPRSVKEGEAGEKLRRIEELLAAKPFGVADLPIEIRRRFEALDGKGTFVLLFPRYSGYDTSEIQLWAEQIDEVASKARAQGINLNILDGNLIAARIFALVRGDGPYILWSAAAVVFAMIWVSLRSLRRAALVAGPLFLGMTCLAGGMKLFGVNLNFINAVVLPNLLAIAVDNSVHLFHRYEEEGPGSLGHVVRSTGFAAVVATLSNAAGYGALLVANHQGLRSIAHLAILGVASTFLGTTVLFPALLALIERWRPRGAPRPAVEMPAELQPLTPSTLPVEGEESTRKQTA